MFKKSMAAALVAVALVAVAGCGAAPKGDAPEPTPDNIIDGGNTQVIRMPDGFRNVAVTRYAAKGGGCYMVFVTSRGIWEAGNSDLTTLPSGIAVVPCGAY